MGENTQSIALNKNKRSTCSLNTCQLLYLAYQIKVANSCCFSLMHLWQKHWHTKDYLTDQHKIIKSETHQPCQKSIEDVGRDLLRLIIKRSFDLNLESSMLPNRLTPASHLSMSSFTSHILLSVSQSHTLLMVENTPPSQFVEC